MHIVEQISMTMNSDELTSARHVRFVPVSRLVAAKVLPGSSVEELEPGEAFVQRQCRVLEVGGSRVRTVVDGRRCAAADRCKSHMNAFIEFVH